MSGPVVTHLQVSCGQVMNGLQIILMRLSERGTANIGKLLQEDHGLI
jgi:hypothetical protein